jgi:hypothetical protein
VTSNSAIAISKPTSNASAIESPQGYEKKRLTFLKKFQSVVENCLPLLDMPRFLAGGSKALLKFKAGAALSH